MFSNRQEAGHLLAQQLEKYRDKADVLILGLARGGIVAAYEIAKELGLPLNVIAPRKIGAPDNPEFALGAIMENGEGVFNESVIRLLGVSQDYLQTTIEKEKAAAQQRLALYRQYTPLPDIKGHTVILVDDGIATGSTMLAAIKGMRAAQASKIIVAVPVAASEALEMMEQAADEVICLYDREDFFGVGLYYRDFRQIEDEEIIRLLSTINKKAANG